MSSCEFFLVSYSYAPVAQLDRVPGYEPGGREFESLRAHHFPTHFQRLAGPNRGRYGLHTGCTLPVPVRPSFRCGGIRRYTCIASVGVRHMLALRLSADIEARLDALAKATGRTKSFYAREAI